MGGSVEAGEPDDGAAGVGAPVRSEQPGERRHEAHASGVGHLAGERLHVGGIRDDAELVAQPLHRRAGDGDRALEGVHRRLVAELVGDRGEQSRRRAHDVGTGVEQHEVAGAVGVLRLAGGEAHLTDRGGVLVAQVAAHRHGTAERTGGAGDAVGVGRRARADGRQHRTWDAEQRQQLVVPVERGEVHQHGAAGVGRVGDVHAAVDPTGQVPDHPAVGGAEHGVAALGGGAHPVDVVEDPLDLAAGEVRGRRQPGAAADQVAASVALEGGSDAVGARVLPHDGVVQRTSGAPVPHDRGLALVGHPEGGEVVRPEAGAVQRHPDHGVGALPDLDRIVLHPPGFGQDLLVLELMPDDLPTVVVEHHEPGARRALVDGANEFGHSVPPCVVPRCCGARSVL